MNTNRTDLSLIQNLACTEDFCHICGRCTDHWGEHDNEQLLAWAAKDGLLQTLLDK